MRVLVTRPREDGEETARQLAMLGHDAILAPLLATEFFDGPALDLTGVQAILATSANGVRAFVRRMHRPASPVARSAPKGEVAVAGRAEPVASESRRGFNIPIFAVGPQTTEEARAAGFTNVHNADGDVRDLARAVTAHADPAKGPLLHIRGENSKAELAGALKAAGFSLRPEILYAMRPQGLPPEALAALSAKNLDAVLLYSPVSAAIFRDAVRDTKVPTAGLLAVCISAATAKMLPPLEFADVRVAARPNQAALLTRLEK